MGCPGWGCGRSNKLVIWVCLPGRALQHLTFCRITMLAMVVCHVRNTSSITARGCSAIRVNVPCSPLTLFRFLVLYSRALFWHAPRCGDSTNFGRLLNPCGFTSSRALAWGFPAGVANQAANSSFGFVSRVAHSSTSHSVDWQCWQWWFAI